jgi:protein FAM50
VVSFVVLNKPSLSLSTMSTSQVEGFREDNFVKKRAQMREEYERRKQALINETEKARPSANRFVGQNESIEDSLKNKTIGLLKLEDFQKTKKELEEAKAREAARTNELKYVLSFSQTLKEEMAYRTLWRILLEMT